jgi:hypothetical protein
MSNLQVSTSMSMQVGVRRILSGDDTRRRLGRPSHIEQAGRLTSQARLGFANAATARALLQRRESLPASITLLLLGSSSADVSMDIEDEL